MYPQTCICGDTCIHIQEEKAEEDPKSKTKKKKVRPRDNEAEIMRRYTELMRDKSVANRVERCVCMRSVYLWSKMCE